MKTSDKTPSELIDHIGAIINERSSKQLPTFYTIYIEQGDKGTPVAEKEEGYDNFKNQISKYITDYNLSSLTVQLFSGKSRNVKTPLQTFKIPLKKQNPTIILGSMENQSNTDNNVQQIDSSIPVSRYYDEKFELQMRIMRTEMEKTQLLEQVNRLTEKYEDKLKDQERLTSEKLKTLQTELQEREQELEELEKEIAKSEKDKHNAFGNIALGSIASHAVESLAKSDFGTGVLKGLLGKSGYETLQGHLAGIEAEKNNPEQIEEKTSTRIVSEPDNKDPRNIALSYIQKVGQSFGDMHLRMLYDLAQIGAMNPNDLHAIWSYAQQYKKQQGTTAQQTPQQETDDDTDDEPTKTI